MRHTFQIVVLLGISLYQGCIKKPKDKEPLNKFVVTNPLRTDTELTQSYVAKIRSIQHIEVRALERGYLQNIYVDEGQQVTRGQKLFQVWPAIYEAELQKANASRQLQEIEYQNTKTLAQKNVVSQKEVAMARAKADEAIAEVNLATTRKGMTEFKAPFNGLVGRFQVRKGSLVDEGDLMTTLSDNSNLWVYFNVSEPEYLNYKALFSGGKGCPVTLMMANGQLFGETGTVDTIESDFDNETGNIAFRAIFTNPNGLLRHGETGKILITSPLKNALLIPQKSTFDVLDKKFVYKVDSEQVVHSQPITVAAELPQVYVVSAGVSEKDTILTEGLRNVTDGVTIRTEFVAADKLFRSLEVPAE